MFSRRFLVDASERVVMTYLEVFAGLMLADQASWTDLGAWTAAGIAAIPAALAAVKSGLATRVGDSGSASLAA